MNNANPVDSDGARQASAARSMRVLPALLVLPILCIASIALAGSPAEPDVAAPAEAAAPPAEPAAAKDDSRDYSMSVRLLGTAAFVDGDVAQFQQRHRIPENVSGGVDAFHFETEIGEDTALELDGRAIFDNHDYLLRLSVENEDKGFLDVGYRQFRTWYDGRGGYFPPADAAFVVFDPQLGIDRGEAWARGGLFLPEGFKLTLGYRYLFRDGTKSSVSWGDSAALGLAPPNNRRSIVPSFYEIDENRHQVDVEVARETETSEVGGGLHYEYTSLDDRRHITRSPGEVGVERRLTERDNSDSDMWGSRIFGTRRLMDGKVTVSGAYAYNDIDLDIAGSRIYGAAFNSSFSLMAPNRQQRDEGFFDLTGKSEMREHVGNLAVAARPFEDFQILAALRVRGENRHAHAAFAETNVGAAPAFDTSIEDLETRSDTEDTSWAEDLELRYRGIENVVLYARGQWEQSDGDIYEAEVEPLVPEIVDLERRTDVERFVQKYAVGTKYYPTRWMNVSTEYSYRISDYDYDHVIDSTSNDPIGPPPSGNRYPAFLVSQDFASHNFNVRGTFRLPGDVGFVARYDWLQSTIDTRGDLLREIESAETRSHLFGATLTWNPANWWWTRAGFNYVLSTVDTATADYDTPVASFLRSFGNDYVTLNLATGMAIDANTDGEFLYTWTSADNDRDVSASSVSYGSRFDEHGVRVRAARRLDEHTRVAVGYGYFINDEGFAGGNYDYDAHIVTTSVEFEY